MFCESSHTTFRTYDLAMRSISKLVISAVIVTPLAIGVGPVLAATTDEISSVIVDKTLAGLGVEVTDQELLAELESDLSDAIDADLINNDIVNAVDDAVDSGTDASLDDKQDQNESEAVDEFVAEKTSLQLAFEAIKTEFQNCRELATGSAKDCALGLGIKFQIAISENMLANIQAKEASLAGLTGDELAAAEAELAQMQKQLENRTMRIAQQLVRLQDRTGVTADVQSDVAQLEQIEVRVQEKVKAGVGASNANPNSGRSASPTPSSSMSSQTNSGNSNGNSSNGNSSNGKSNSGNSSNGKSNGKSVTPSQTPSTGATVSE